MPRSNAQPVGTVKTQRNRRVACDADGQAGCGFAVYVSRKQLVRAGVWACPACDGGSMLPVDPDDAALVLDAEALEQHPAVVEYRQAVASAARGQAGPARSLAGRGKSYSPDVPAMARVERERRERARARQLSGLRRGAAESVPAWVPDDEMPF